MSDWQWAGMMLGDEAYAGSRNFYHLEDGIRRNYGYKYVIPTHQGRGAEHILSRVLIKPGDVIPGNLTDGCTMSAKKDALVNIGGFLAVNEADVFEEARNLVVVYEGLHTYGGMSGRDMEAVARGIEESLQDDHIHARVGQVLYLGEKICSYGVPIVHPVGGHGVFLDARAFLPHLPQSSYPAQALAAAIYLDSGVRSMERGAVSAGRDRDTGEEHYPRWSWFV